jgi:hypothetical protein
MNQSVLAAYEVSIVGHNSLLGIVEWKHNPLKAPSLITIRVSVVHPHFACDCPFQNLYYCPAQHPDGRFRQTIESLPCDPLVPIPHVTLEAPPVPMNNHCKNVRLLLTTRNPSAKTFRDLRIAEGPKLMLAVTSVFTSLEAA